MYYLHMIFLLWKVIVTVGTLMVWVLHIVRRPVMTFWVHFAPMKMTIKHAILMAVQVIFDLNQARVIEYDVNTPN